MSSVVNLGQPAASRMLATSPARTLPAAHRSDDTHSSAAANGSSLVPLICSSDLPLVIRRAFDLEHDQVVSDLPVLADFAGRRLRFDLDHPPASGNGDRATLGNGRSSSPRQRPSAGEHLSEAMGLASARDLLEAQNWVVLVIDSRQGDVQLAEGVLASLAHLRRFLMIWCEGESPQPVRPAGSARLFEQLLAEPGLAQVGPVGGVPVEGMVALIHALKALDQSVLLRLRVRDAAPHEEPSATVSASPANGKPPRNGRNGTKPNGRRSRPSHAAAITDEVRANGAHFSGPGAVNPGGNTEKTSCPGLETAVRAVAELAAADSRVVAVSLSSDARLEVWQQAHPEWFLRPPSVEMNALAWCAGLAEGNCHPMIFLGDNAAARDWSAMLESAGGGRLPLTLLAPSHTAQFGQRAPSAPLVRSHHLPLLPGAVVMAPSTAGELAAMLRFSAERGRTTAIALPEQFPDPTGECLTEPIALGRSQRLLSGDDLALVGWGATLDVARGAAFELARRGIQAAVINLRFLEPLDRRVILEMARRVRGLVLLEDESLRLDAAGRLLRLLASERRTAPVAHCVVRQGARRDAYETAVAEIVNRGLRLAARPPARRRGPVRIDAKTSGSPPHSHSLQPLPSPDAERSAVMRLELSGDVQRWVAAYAEVGKRNPYLWKWARRGVDLTTLPFVRDELRADVCDSKVLSIMLCVLLDDVADEHGKSRLLDCLFEIMAERSAPDFSPLTAEERRYAELARRLTGEYEERIARYPRHEQYAELLRYDAAQFVNTLRYSHLLNRNIHLLNLAEHDLYLPHNMHMMSFATLDLMCSHDFPDQELGKLREAIWHAQCMGRIGNLLSTWRREVKQRDFTSGVFARAVMQGDLTLDQLAGADPAGIERAIDGGRHEQYFVQRWQRHRDCFQRAAARIAVVNLTGLLESHDRFLQMHLSSRGLI